jgi:hypothetical protein
MLRVAADCDEVPPEVLILVKDLAQHACRHILKVCCTLWSVYIYSYIFVHSIATSFECSASNGSCLLRSPAEHGHPNIYFYLDSPWFLNEISQALETSALYSIYARYVLLWPYISFADLMVSASAIAVEHICSGRRDPISLRRANLKPETIQILMLVKQRLHLAHNAAEKVLRAW